MAEYIKQTASDLEKQVFMESLEIRAGVIGRRGMAGDELARDLYNTWKEITKDGVASYTEINLIADDFDNYFETYAIESKYRRAKEGAGL